MGSRDGHLRVAGLFAGIGGFELGLQRAGHEVVLLCEKEEPARRVLAHRFPCVPLIEDVAQISRLAEVDLVTAGFPCQDLSQVGGRSGITGAKSGVVRRLFTILESSKVPWVLIENVPFMLWLDGGSAIRFLITELERLGYSWAYRVVDSRAFGLPQRRRRVFLLASRVTDPSPILLGVDSDPILDPRPRDILLAAAAVGFYWTEGNRGAGWVANAVPALKPGSSKGIPSPPAVLLPSGAVGLPGIRDAERLQGFPRDWTVSADTGARRRNRWRLVGNAVSVPIAEWIGRRICGNLRGEEIRPFEAPCGTGWPRAARGHSGVRMDVRVGPFPVRRKMAVLTDILGPCPHALSSRAAAGFANRLSQSRLSPPEGFLRALWAHARGSHSWQE